MVQATLEARRQEFEEHGIGIVPYAGDEEHVYYCELMGDRKRISMQFDNLRLSSWALVKSLENVLLYGTEETFDLDHLIDILLDKKQP